MGADLSDRIAARLAELRQELDKGQQLLADLDERREGLRESLLRISGAIQVLEELGDGRPAVNE